MTSGGWPARQAASRRTVACPAMCQAASPATSSRSGTKMAAASAKPGTAASVTSRAVRVRSSVLPIRAAASLSQPGPGCGEVRCAVTSDPLPGPASGSQWMATGPPPAAAMASVPVQGRPASTSASARPASSRSPGLASTSRRSRPVTVPAARPNSSAAAAGQQATRPRESRVNAARPAGSAPCVPDATGSSSPAIGNSTGARTSLDAPSRPGRRPCGGPSAQMAAGHSPPRQREYGQRLPVPSDIVQSNVSHYWRRNRPRAGGPVTRRRQRESPGRRIRKGRP